jgi:hypothetical protein
LVSRVAQWVGAIPSTTGITASAFNSSTGVVTTTTNPTSAISVGDFVGISVTGPFCVVLATAAGNITVDDADGIFTGVTFPVTLLKIPTQSAIEIQSCVQFAELKMRTLELPALRSDPYSGVDPAILTTNSQGMAPIPALGPWIIYDRVGDREIIRRRMIDQLYVRPFGVPRVIRASFSEVGPNYVFTPNPGANTTIKAYYYRTFPFLFSATDDPLYPVVQSNAVLASFPEGYFYGTLWAYYDKNKNVEEAQKWISRLEEAYGLIEDQNYKGKWTGGDQHLTSEFQPRDYRYSFK